MIDRIEMYGRPVEFIDAGLTARLRLRVGTKAPRPFTTGDVLAESDRP